MKCKEVNKQVGNKQVIKHIKDSLRSYLPGESISADVVGLASDFSPEGFDGVLVLCSETHLVCRLFQVEVLGPVRTVGGFIHTTGHGHTRPSSKIGCVAFGLVPNVAACIR